MRFQITDDSGFLALIDPKGYEAFVSRDWELDQLFNHFKEQMKRQRLLIWGTGSEGTHEVEVSMEFSETKGFREVIGYIQVNSGELCLINYESLTFAAMFPEIKLPEDHMRDLIVNLKSGFYQVRIIQRDDPDKDFVEGYEGLRFRVEFRPARRTPDYWRNIPWHND